MTRILDETFEGGAAGATVTTSSSAFSSVVTGATITHDATSVLFGSLDMKCGYASNTAYGVKTLTAASTMYVRFYVWLDTNPAAAFQMAGVLSGATNRCQLAVSATGKTIIRNGNTAVTTGAQTITGSKWVRIEWDIVGTLQTVRIYFGANLNTATPTETITGAASGNTFDSFRIGVIASPGNTGIARFSQVAVDDSAQPGQYVPSGSFSGSGSLSTTALPAFSDAASLSGSGSLSATGNPAVAGSATLSGSGALVATGQPSAAGSASLSGSGSLVAGGTPRPVGSASLSGSGSLVASGTAGSDDFFGSATLSGSGSLSAGGTIGYSGSASLSGSGSLSAGGASAAAGAATFSGSGSLSAGGTVGYLGTAILSGSGSLTAGGTSAQTGSAQLTGSGQLDAGGSPVVSGSAQLSGSGQLEAGGAPAVAGVAILSGSGQLDAQGFKVTPAPISRTMFILQDGRAVAIRAERRSLIVPFDLRTVVA